MPKYQIYFDTVSGETKYNVDIDDGETLDMVLEEILFDLRERGDMLKGDGEPEVLWNGKTLDFATGLNAQGVHAGDVLRGLKKPVECKLFGTLCSPEMPMGSCMVSPEGACAAHWTYGRFRDRAAA